VSLPCEVDDSKAKATFKDGVMELVNVGLKQFLRLLTNSTADAENAWALKHLMRSKCLGFKTTYEVFEELTGVNIRNLHGLCTYYLN
jgi:hypothetical protein